MDCRAPKNNEGSQIHRKENMETAFTVGSGIMSEEAWIMDSGASAHMCFERDYFWVFDELESTSNVVLGNNKSLPVKGKGIVKIKKLINGQWYDSTINEVLFVPELKKNFYRKGF